MSRESIPSTPAIHVREAIAKRSTWASVIVNSLLTTAQVLVGLLSGSQGLLADGLHSLSDLIADFVVLVALKFSQREPDEDHPYGHHRFENAASMFLGVLLVMVGAAMAWSAIVKLHHSEVIPRVHLMALWAAFGALAVKEGLFRYMLAAAKRARSDLLVANAWHARSDAASSLVVAIGIIGNLLGFSLLDPIAALIVGALVGKIGLKFAWNAFNDLADRAASQQEIDSVVAVILATPGIQGFHHLRTRRMGSLTLVDVHLEISGSLSVAEGHAIALQVRQRVMDHCPTVLNLMTHVDPV